MSDSCYYCGADVPAAEGAIKPGPDGQPITVCGSCLAPGRKRLPVEHDENGGVVLPAACLKNRVHYRRGHRLRSLQGKLAKIVW